MKDELIKITNPQIAIALITLGIPLERIENTEGFLFVFKKNIQVHNIITLFEKNKDFIYDEMDRLKVNNKIEKLKSEEDPRYKDLKKEYKKMTHGIKGAPTSRSGGTHKQYLG